jgi:hypothetical protein
MKQINLFHLVPRVSSAPHTFMGCSIVKYMSYFALWFHLGSGSFVLYQHQQEQQLHERTISTERPPLVGEISAKVWG